MGWWGTKCNIIGKVLNFESYFVIIINKYILDL